MKVKLITTASFFILCILTVTLLFAYQDTRRYMSREQETKVVDLNEIRQLARKAANQNDTEALAVLEEKIDKMQYNIKSDDVSNQNMSNVTRDFVVGGIGILFVFSVFGYVYFAILRPFDKMKSYAESIAAGNFDKPLNYERSNYFGAFTWAFDHMRIEIMKARACEREAIENNKTVIATLSHDIRTPVASVRAYAEGLEANLAGSVEKRQKYLSVIIKKCDEVTKLTDDLFLHSISDLEKLKIQTEPLEICSFINNTVAELTADKNDVRFEMPDFEAWISADRNRLLQLTENLVNNSRKYAKTDICISLEQKDGEVFLRIRDYGKGIPDKDMPFIFDKFYRGSNIKSENGSGLGLYIVKYIVDRMNGKIILHNLPDGLEAVVSFPTNNQ